MIKKTVILSFFIFIIINGTVSANTIPKIEVISIDGDVFAQSQPYYDSNNDRFTIDFSNDQVVISTRKEYDASFTNLINEAPSHAHEEGHTHIVGMNFHPRSYDVGYIAIAKNVNGSVLGTLQIIIRSNQLQENSFDDTNILSRLDSLNSIISQISTLLSTELSTIKNSLNTTNTKLDNITNQINTTNNQLEEINNQLTRSEPIPEWNHQEKKIEDYKPNVELNYYEDSTEYFTYEGHEEYDTQLPSVPTPTNWTFENETIIEDEPIPPEKPLEQIEILEIDQQLEQQEMQQDQQLEQQEMQQDQQLELQEMQQDQQLEQQEMQQDQQLEVQEMQQDQQIKKTNEFTQSEPMEKENTNYLLRWKSVNGEFKE